MAEQEYQIRNKHMLIVSALLGLVTVVLFLWHDYRIRRENEEDMIPVICASKDLAVGDKLSNENMEIIRFPQKLVPMDSRTDIAQGPDFNALLNMDVYQEVTGGRIIRWSYLGAGGSNLGDPGTPKVGYRLVGIATGRESCPPGLRVGNYVDLKSVLPDGKLVTLMERMLVKQINGVGAVGATSRNIDSVSIEVREQDADKLIAFQSLKMKITLLVRNPEEKTELKGFNPALDGLLKAAGGVRPD